MLTGLKCESPDAKFGLHIKGITRGLYVAGSRIAGRVGLYVGRDGGLINSRIGGTSAIQSFQTGAQYKPVRVEGQIQGTILDIGAYNE